MTSEKKILAFEQLPELIQNLVERIESLEKTVREKQQPLPLEGELMSVEDVCKLLSYPIFIRLFSIFLAITPQSDKFCLFL